MIKTGDHVLHKPSGETWIVAYVDGSDIAWCGWPSGFARVLDCEIVKVATHDESRALLREMAEMSEGDHRRRYARLALGLDN